LKKLGFRKIQETYALEEESHGQETGPAHPLDVLANGDRRRSLPSCSGKARRRQPDLYVKIDEEDLKGFEDCVNYLKVVRR